MNGTDARAMLPQHLCPSFTLAPTVFYMNTSKLLRSVLTAIGPIVSVRYESGVSVCVNERT